MLFCYVSVLRKKSRLSRAGPAHLLGPAYPLDLLSRFRPLPRTDSQRCESGRDCYSLPKKDEFKIKKPAAPAPHAPATVLFPGFAVPAKAGGIVTPCTGNQRFKIKKPAATYFPAFAVSSAQRCLTSVFGMGTGIATSPWPPASITMPASVGSGLWKPGSFGLVVQSVSGMHSRYAQHKVKR